MKLNYIIFVGECNLCNGVISWVRRNDTKNLFTFIPFQSNKGKELLAFANLPTDRLDSIVLFQQTTIYIQSEALVKILLHLKYWKIAGYIMKSIPLKIRNRIYGIAAKNRVVWFGSKTSCSLYDSTVKK